MLHYDRIDVREGTDPAKSTGNKACMVCHYWFFNHGFKYEDSVCNDCHNLTMLCLNISDIAMITIEGVDYRCVIDDVSNSKQFIF